MVSRYVRPTVLAALFTVSTSCILGTTQSQSYATYFTVLTKLTLWDSAYYIYQISSNPDPYRRIKGALITESQNASGSTIYFNDYTDAGGSYVVSFARMPGEWGFKYSDTGHCSPEPWEETYGNSDVYQKYRYATPGGALYLECNMPETEDDARLEARATDVEGDIIPESILYSPGDSNTMSGSGNQYLFPNDNVVYSPSGRFRLQYQGDGNLVLVDTSTSPWTPVWASGTNDNNPGAVAMQDDGNFVIYNGDNQPVWASNTNDNEGAYLVVSDDGQLIVCASDGTPIWWSH